MRPIPILLAALPFALHAQSTTNVEMGGSLVGGAEPYYAPQNVTINVGDSVKWTNVSGSHNVEGSTVFFPGNPESFTSGEVTGGPWTFTFGFTVPGLYNYHCTSGGHAATQFGTITVVDNTIHVEEVEQAGTVTLFPVPTSGYLSVELGSLDIRTADVFSVDGQRVATSAVNGRSRVDMELGDLASGNYFLRLIAADGRTITRPFRKE